jgi:putative transposase
VKKSRFSEEQIIAVLREQEDGMKTADLCRKHGISSATLYAWKAKYGGMDVSQARKLKVLEDENARLKRLLADAMLDNAVLKEATAKKLVRPAAQRKAVEHAWQLFGISERRARISLASRAKYAVAFLGCRAPRLPEPTRASADGSRHPCRHRWIRPSPTAASTHTASAR